MADIELVIKIPEHYYENNIKKELPLYLSEDNIVAILPKGHGILIDTNEITAFRELERNGHNVEDFDEFTVIVEADGGDAE